MLNSIGRTKLNKTKRITLDSMRSISLKHTHDLDYHQTKIFKIIFKIFKIIYKKLPGNPFSSII